jgi:hypothetical protein
MDYCRSLKFEQEPNYKTCFSLFETCLQRHNLDGKLLDYTWKQNRLSKDKEALKNSVLNVIRKKPAAIRAPDSNGNTGTNGNNATPQPYGA